MRPLRVDQSSPAAPERKGDLLRYADRFSSGAVRIPPPDQRHAQPEIPNENGRLPRSNPPRETVFLDLTWEPLVLVEPQPTAYDLRFAVMGFPTRVSPLFFVTMALLGYGGAMGNGLFPPAVALSMWVGVGFVSILLHEMGHTLLMRRYGLPSRIVLYHFGGLAIPEGSYYGTRLQPQHQMAISAAGPGIQLALAALIVAALAAGGFYIPVPGSGIMSYLIPESLSGERPLPPAIAMIVFYALQVNIYWALLNLVPIYPLDGGQISRELLIYFRVPDAVRKSLMISVATAIVLVAYFLKDPPQTYMALMFGVLGFQCYTTLQRF